MGVDTDLSVRMPAYPTTEYVDPSKVIEQGQEFVLASRHKWSRFLYVQPSLRSWLSNTMIYFERLTDYLINLQAADITPELQAQLGELPDIIEKLIIDFRSPYFDNAALALLGLERIQNRLFRGKRKQLDVARININMTDANKADPSHNLGTAYRYMVLKWLQREFGIRNVSLSPEGTSFLIINAPHDMVAENLGHFNEELRILLEQKETQGLYKYDKAKLRKFEPRAMGMSMTINAEELDIDDIVSSGDKVLILDLQNRIIAKIEHALRVLAVGAALAEKDPESVGLRAGRSVYRASALPIRLDNDPPDKTFSPEHERDFRERFDVGFGFVPASVYNSSLARIAYRHKRAPNETMGRRPRFGHMYGFVHHEPRPQEGDNGGGMQVLNGALQMISQARTIEEIESALVRLEMGVGLFAKIFDLGEVARVNARNPALTKYAQGIRLHDGSRKTEHYFIEEVALRPEEDVHIVVVEIDSFKAFSAKYGVDEVDSNFWEIFEQFFWVAKKSSIRQPSITQVGGDLIAVAVPTVDEKGNPVDLQQFINGVQNRVRRIYSDRPFQDFGKVALPNGSNGTQIVERRPLWVVDDEYVASENQPEEGKPYMRTLTISSVGTTIPTPTTVYDRLHFYKLIDRLNTEVDALKERTSPEKGESEILSYRDILWPEQPALDGITSPPEEEFVDYSIVLSYGAAGEDTMLATDGIDGQFSAAWGSLWDNLPNSSRRPVLEYYAQLCRSRANGPFTPIHSAVSRMVGSSVRFPPVNFTIYPMRLMPI